MRNLMMLSFTVWAFAGVAQAKVADFNSIINENISAQKDLHNQLRGELGETRSALDTTPHKPLAPVVETKDSAINVPTSKSLLRFRKEVVNHQASDKAREDRLANEFQSDGLQF